MESRDKLPVAKIESVGCGEDLMALLPVSRETVERLEIYVTLLRRWNAAINLVGKASLAEVWQRHIWDSAQLFPLLPPEPADRDRALLDLGTGAGLPGLVLAILGAGQMHLAEADQRKTAFLREATRETGATITIHAGRIEDLAAFPVDVVLARALAPLDRLLGLAAPFLGPGSQALFLKGRGLQDELTLAEKGWKMRYDVLPSRSSPDGRILRLSRVEARG